MIPGMQIVEDLILPKLRPDIQLNEAPPEHEGAPTWTLYDPAANKYYKIGWFEFECLSRFGRARSLQELLGMLENETTLHPDENAIKALMMFLVYNNLVISTGPQTAQYFETERMRRQHHWWQKMLHGYLYFTIPVFRPQDFLQKTYPYISFMFSRQFFAIVLMALLYGLFLSAQRWDEVATTFMSYMSFEGAMLFLATTIIVKSIHELGHAYMATKYGVPVPTMGVAFLVMYPVLYTETTNAWKLQSRRDRLNIAAAGVMAETMLAAIAINLWHMLDPGIAQSVCFMIAFVSLGASLAINFNPLMRYDGYYLFSDFFGYDNLQDRAFAFAKWKIRAILWGWNDNPPEALPEKRRNFLTVFGFAMLVYRFILYSGIALLVYHVFFQPLGFFLMMVEYGFFIFLPVWRELIVWKTRFTEISPFSRGGLAAVVIGCLLILSLVPMHLGIEIPAVMHAESYKKLYAPIPAKIETVLAQEGQHVKKDQPLFRLSSPILDYNITLVSQRLKNLESIRDTSQSVPTLAKKRVTITSEIEKTRKELDGYLSIKSQLDIRAPYEGIIRDLDKTLHAGEWVGTHHTLALLIDTHEPALSGYIRERDLGRLPEGTTKGTFYPEFSPLEKYDVVLQRVDQTDVSEIYWGELSSVHHGPLPSERDGHGGIKALPRYTIYAAHFAISETSPPETYPDFIARGTIRLEGASTSMANILIKKAVSVIFREGGI